jgi:oligopeptide/dipeptide ABC transporter ATP-binding protein
VNGDLLQVERLTKHFTIGRRGLTGQQRETIAAVDDVSFTIRRGETVGLVGETGCGKSTVARCILRLTQPTSGRVLFDGIDITTLPASEMRKLRRRIQIVFQDPYSSLDPRMSTRAIVEEPLLIHGVGTRTERGAMAEEMLSKVGISHEYTSRKPHEFSGGQRQRIAVARALVLRPDLVVLDEPVSALDVSIQAQVLNLLRSLQEQLGLTYLFIVHDLAVAEYFCDRIAVLYLGAVMEYGQRDLLFRKPLHPYTHALLSAAPIPDPASSRRRQRIVLKGEVTAVSAERKGCRFRPRCPVGRDRSLCAEVEPPLEQHVSGQWAACHFPGELAQMTSETTQS